MSSDKPGCLSPPEAERAAACDTFKGSVTNEEATVLAAMRALKAEVKDLKLQRREAKANGDETTLAAIDASLAEAHSRWGALEQHREQARHRRMVMLGHVL